MGNACATSRVKLSFDSEDGFVLDVGSAEKRVQDDSVVNADIGEIDSLMARMLVLEEQAQSARMTKTDRVTFDDLQKRVRALARAKYPEVDQMPEIKAPAADCKCGKTAGEKEPSQAVNEEKADE